MKGFRHTGNGPKAGHSFPSSFGFSSSSVGNRQQLGGFPRGTPQIHRAIGGLVPERPPKSKDGRSAGSRSEPPTQQLAEHGGRTPLLAGYKKGGHHRDHLGRFAKGGHVHMDTDVAKEAAGSGDFAKGGSAHGFKKGGKHWMKGAVKHPGVFKAAAKRHGMSTHAYAEKEKHASGKVGRRARLALTFEKERPSHHAEGGLHGEHASGLSHAVKGFETKQFSRGGRR